MLDHAKHIFYSDPMSDLYTEEFKKIMKVNSDYTSMSSNRVEEIMNFARGAGFKRIGIAHCITFGREARILKIIFQNTSRCTAWTANTGVFPRKILLAEAAWP